MVLYSYNKTQPCTKELSSVDGSPKNCVRAEELTLKRSPNTPSSKASLCSWGMVADWLYPTKGHSLGWQKRSGFRWYLNKWSNLRKEPYHFFYYLQMMPHCGGFNGNLPQIRTARVGSLFRVVLTAFWEDYNWQSRWKGCGRRAVTHRLPSLSSFSSQKCFALLQQLWDLSLLSEQVFPGFGLGLRTNDSSGTLQGLNIRSK